MNKLLSDLDFSQAKVLIAGDMMLDRYYYGTVSRISPEAPVPVVNVKSEIYTLGGAGNVVNNIKGLSAQCTIIGAAKKDDDAGRLLNNLFTNIQAKSFFIDADMPTISKLRVIGSKQQIVRLDFEDIHVFSESVNNQIKSIFDAELVNHNIVVISDYGKGLCSPEICFHIIEQSNKQNKKVTDTEVSAQQIVDLYHEICKSYPKVRSLSETRKKAIKARLRKYSLDDFRELFEKAEASDFLKGNNSRNWSATFDWLINEQNMTKVLEGNYQNRQEENVHGTGDNQNRGSASDQYRKLLESRDC